MASSCICESRVVRGYKVQGAIEWKVAVETRQGDAEPAYIFSPPLTVTTSPPSWRFISAHQAPGPVQCSTMCLGPTPGVGRNKLQPVENCACAVNILAENPSPSCPAQNSAAFSISGQSLNAKMVWTTVIRAATWSRMALPGGYSLRGVHSKDLRMMRGRPERSRCR